MNKKERNAMFKIHDDKVYFVAETPDINKVIEIFLPKDDRGTIMDSHEIRVDLCRAVIHMEKKGVRVLTGRCRLPERSPLQLGNFA
jgi:hypothetical protein